MVLVLPLGLVVLLLDERRVETLLPKQLGPLSAAVSAVIIPDLVNLDGDGAGVGGQLRTRTVAHAGHVIGFIMGGHTL